LTKIPKNYNIMKNIPQVCFLSHRMDGFFLLLPIIYLLLFEGNKKTGTSEGGLAIPAFYLRDVSISL